MPRDQVSTLLNDAAFDDIKRYVKSVYRSANNDKEKALELLLRTTAPRRVIKEGWDYFLRAQTEADRSIIISPGRGPVARKGEQPHGNTRQFRDALTQYFNGYTLQSGIKAPDATHEDWVDEAERYKVMADGCMVKVNFAKAMVRLVPEGKRTRDVCRPEEFGKLAKKFGVAG